MSETHPVAGKNVRTDVQRVVWGVCIAVVAVASFLERKAGACGTAHHLFVALGGSVAANMITAVIGEKHLRGIEYGAAVILNVAVFAALTRIWYRKTSGAWHSIGLVAFTLLYLASYFFLFPTRDCP